MTIKQYIAKFSNWEKTINDTSIQLIIDRRLSEITPNSPIKYIIIGDNPGRKEADLKEYFVGNAGKNLKQFLNEELGFEINFDKEVIFLNKTPIYTPTTKDLDNLNKLPNDLLIEMQKSVVELIGKLSATFKDSQIWVLGIGKENLIRFNCFFREIYLLQNISERVLLFYHPSRGWFKKSVKLLMKERVNLKDNKSLICKLGKENKEKHKKRFS